MRFGFGGIIPVVDDACVRLELAPITALGFASGYPQPYTRRTATMLGSRSAHSLAASAVMPLPREYAPFVARREIRRPACCGLSV